MFFILSKVLYFIIMPLNWVIALLLVALFSKNPKIKKRSLLMAVVLILFFTNTLIVNQVTKWWEYETVTAGQISESYEIGILLGGFTNSYIIPNHDRLNFSFRANRFINTYELYKTGKIKKILITGGTDSVLQKVPKEALIVRDFLVRIGVPEDDIIIEADARNTYENAVFTKKLIDTKWAGASCLLITSAFHMRRSIGCFKKAGLKCVPYSVDFMTEKDRWNPMYLLVPDWRGFFYWEVLIKEWIGYNIYWLKGYL
jgi:uncharacterized SAM-binding protein YcdF (DUF218 family)